MATLVQGFDGDVTLPSGWVIKVQGWSISTNQDVREVTGFSDSGYKDRIFGCFDWDCTVNGLAYSDSGSTPLVVTPGISGSIVLTASTGDTFSGVVLLSSQNTTRNTCEEMPVTLNFMGKGALQQLWVGS
jgi:hypothetical protein